jgi:hypothetical protein
VVFCPFYLDFLCSVIGRDGALCCLIRAMLAGLATHWLHEGKEKTSRRLVFSAGKAWRLLGWLWSVPVGIRQDLVIEPVISGGR